VNQPDELPREIRTLDEVNQQVCNAIREYSISHSLDPVRRTSIGADQKDPTTFEEVERAIMEREKALLAYQEQMEMLKERFESNNHEQVQESIREILIESSRKGTSESPKGNLQL